jgi:hypothetical protein
MLESMLVQKKKKGGGAIHSYDDFTAFTSASTANKIASDGILNAFGDNIYIQVSLDPAKVGNAGNNYSSPWGGESWHSLPLYRVIQHCAPTQAIWNELSGSKRVVLIKIGVRVFRTGGWQGITRNGWTTTAYAGYTSGWPVLDLIFWDESTQTAKRCNPFTKQAVATVFDGKLL